MRSPRHVLAAMLALALAAPDPAQALDARSHARHLLRRFAFSAAPAELTRVQERSAAWFEEQLQPRSGDDPELAAHLEPAPARTNAKGEVPDYPVYERRLIEREIFTKWQVREKLTLHWLEHFSVGVSKVGDWTLMGRYEAVLRAGALGNFKTLLSRVSREPAMLLWLDNNDNDSSGKQPPNENFARELLQLYVMGTGRYTQADVRETARALSGWSVDCNDEEKVKNPEARCKISYHPEMHPAGVRRILGHRIVDDGSARTLEKVLDVLVRDPSTAPFQARELLQRFVTDSPSPQYVARIAEVWKDGVDRPDQIARAVAAIVRDPEFDESYRELIKEPLELYVGLLRELPVTLKRGVSDGTPVPPCSELAADGGGYLLAAGQQPYDPPSVFSFYRPGRKESLLSAQFMSARLQGTAALVFADAADVSTATALDLDALARTLPGEPDAMAAALFDALDDAPAPALRERVVSYLRAAPEEERLRGAIVLIVTSPEYQVN